MQPLHLAEVTGVVLEVALAAVMAAALEVVSGVEMVSEEDSDGLLSTDHTLIMEVTEEVVAVL